jgi:hypothetical protein
MKNVNSFQIVFYAADCVDSRLDARFDAGLNVDHVVCVDDSVFNDDNSVFDDDNSVDNDDCFNDDSVYNSVYDNSVYDDSVDRVKKF